MRALLALALLAALGAGLLLVTTAGGRVRAVEPPPAAPATPAGASAGELEALRRALAELGARVERLELAASSPALAPAASQRVAAPAVSPAELEELRELVAALKDPEHAAARPLEDLVLGVIEAREQREREQREQARLDAAAERMERRVAELAEELGLSSYQSGEVLSILTGEQVERDRFFAEMRDGGSFDREALRSGMEALRTSTLEALERVLAPDQYDRYVELNPGVFFGAFPRGGPDGAPGGRGGGSGGR